MSHEKRLKDLGIILPALPQPKGAYLPGVVHGGLLYLSGQGPLLEDGTLATGVVGEDVTIEQANVHARRTGLVLLAVAQRTLGTLDKVDRVLNVLGMVNGAPSFEAHPQVIDGCSDLFIEVFGESGKHTRAAVGMATLPDRITVEITAVLAVKS